MKMKFLSSIVVFILISGFIWFQTTKPSIDWTYLSGKWECDKVILIKGKDSTDESKQYKPYFIYYLAGSKYRDEFPEGNTTVDGKYKIDKTKNTISFLNMVQTTKFPGGKVAVPDYVFNSGKQKLLVFKLNADSLVLIQKYIPNTESQGDDIFYMKRVK